MFSWMYRILDRADPQACGSTRQADPAHERLAEPCALSNDDLQIVAGGTGSSATIQCLPRGGGWKTA